MISAVPLDEAKKRIPMRRLGKPEEVASLVGFLFRKSRLHHRTGYFC